MAYRDGFTDDASGGKGQKKATADHSPHVCRSSVCDCGHLTLWTQDPEDRGTLNGEPDCNGCGRPILPAVYRPFVNSDPLKDGRVLVFPWEETTHLPEEGEHRPYWRNTSRDSRYVRVEMLCACRQWIEVGVPGIDFGIDEFGAIDVPVWHETRDGTCRFHRYLRLMGWTGRQEEGEPSWLTGSNGRRYRESLCVGV